MFTIPKLLSSYTPLVIDPRLVLLLHESDPRILEGRLYALIVPLLDGRRTVEEIISELDGRASAAEVLYVLELLEGRGHLVEHDPETPPEVAAFWHSLGVDTRALARRLAETAVALTSLGQASSVKLGEALASLGVRTRAQGDLSVIVTDDYLEPEIDAHNRRALADGRPLMLVKLIGASAFIGPIFHPGRTACWACLAQRLSDNRPLEATLARARGGTSIERVSRAALPAAVSAAANLAAIEIAKWIAGAGGRLDGKLCALDAAGLTLSEHAVVKRPQCPACGDPRPRATMPVTLERRRKRFTADGGHRAASPEETISTYAHHVSPITGALRALVRLFPESSPGVYTYDAGPNLAFRSDDFQRVKKSFRERSGGKGKSDVEARASALAEGLERYSGVFQGDEPRTRARACDLGGAAIHPNTCMNFSAAQYEERRAWNSQPLDPPHRVPEPFDASLEIDWSPLWSLTEEEVKYLPTAYCYYSYPQPGEGRFCYADSNGCAAGASREEAILHGFMELVERDGVSLWWYHRLRRPRLDLTSFDEPYFEEIAAFYRSLGRELWALDLTADLGIPTFAALSRSTLGPHEEITLGFGAHFDARIAALRAVTESNQFLNLVHGKTPFSSSPPQPEDSPMRAWMTTVTLANQPYLDFDRAAPPRVASDYPGVASDDIADDVRRCVAVAKRLGLSTLVLDQTRPDIGLPVVRVVVPGLRHFWRRLGPGRLYDVPVKLGWLDAPPKEHEMNPLYVFF